MFCAALATIAPAAALQDAPAAAKVAAVTRVTGEVTAVSASEITVKTDAGTPATFKLGPSTSFLRVSPGEKDLTKATRITPTEIGVGDRVLARIPNAPEGQPANPARLVYLMNKAELAKHQETSRGEWQKRGVAGKVDSVDASGQSFSIKVQTPTGLKDFTVQASAKTNFRRYATDSIRFSDAKPSTFADVKAGDNIRVLGDRNAEGTSIAAEEVVSGTFRNIAGTIIAIDAEKGELRVNDLQTKKPITVKITADTSLKKLPLMMATMMARSRNGAAGGPGAGGPGAGGPGAGGPPAGGDFAGRGAGAPRGPGGPGAPGAGRPAGAPGAGAGSPDGAGGFGGGQRAPGGRDFQQMLERVPAITVADLKPGDALIISGTGGADANSTLAVTVMAGVEPLLTASPTGQSVLNGSWNFGEVGLPQ